MTFSSSTLSDDVAGRESGASEGSGLSCEVLVPGGLVWPADGDSVALGDVVRPGVDDCGALVAGGPVV